METKQATYVTLAATDNVSIYNWKGQTRIQINETKESHVEIAEIDTTELLRGVSYFLRNVADNADDDDTVNRILTDIMKTLETKLKVAA